MCGVKVEASSDVAGIDAIKEDVRHVDVPVYYGYAPYRQHG
jgi:hypothetical protein